MTICAITGCNTRSECIKDTNISLHKFTPKMYECTSRLLDEILTETRNYRCEYMNILIEKYVKTQDESVEINIRTYRLTKSTKINCTSFLKRVQDKPFGYVSSYECKAAKKPINLWKKQVILQKRAAYRRKFGAESSNANSGKSLKYLSPTKAFLSIQRDTLNSSEEGAESILSNETVLDGDQTFIEENESILSYEDEDNSLSTDKNDHLSANNSQMFSNPKIKNRVVNLLKLNDSKRMLIKNNNSAFNDRCDDKALKTVCQTLSACFKRISPQENRNTYDCCKGTSFEDYILSKSTPKFRFGDFELGISGKNCQASSHSGAISLPYASNKSIESPKLRHWKDRMLKFNNSYEASNDCNDKSSYVSNKSTGHPKLRSREDGMEIPNKNGQSSNDCSAKSLLVSSKSAELSKLSPSKIRIKKSDKNCGISNNYTAKSLSYDLNKSNEAPKLRSRGDKMVISNKNSQPPIDCNAKSLPYVSNHSAELSKFSFSKIGIESSNKSCRSSSDYAAKSLSCVLNESTQDPKLRSVEDKTVTVNKNCRPSGVCNVKSVSCASKKLTEAPKLRPRENGMVISDKDFQPSSACNVKSSIYAPSKSVEPLKHRYSVTETRTSNRKCQTSLNSFPLNSTSLSSSLNSNPDISVEIDPLSIKRGSYDKKLKKKKSSLAQITLPFRKCKSFTIQDAKIDDLSFKKTSTPQKIGKNRQKEANLKLAFENRKT